MTPTRTLAAVLLAALTGAAAAAYSAQDVGSTQGQSAKPAVPLINRALVVLDPAHGASDNGATLGDQVYEKDATLAVAGRLRAALGAVGFTVWATRDNDPSDPIPTDQRAEIANRGHAVACVVIHATASGAGIHLYTSELQPAPEPEANADLHTFVPVLWDMAQAGSVRESLTLAQSLGAALKQAGVPVVVGRAPLRPLDNLMCPAVAIEIAPLAVAGGDATTAADAGYQQSVATTVAGALKIWRDQNFPPVVRPATQPAAPPKGQP